MHKKSAILLLGLSLAGCSLSAPPSPEGSAIPVAATFYPWAYFLQQVGADRVRVTSVVPNGVEPHDFEPGPGDIAAIRSARLLVSNGAGLDEWAGKAANGASDPSPIHIRVSDATGPGTQDPHFWLDPIRVQAVVTRMEQALADFDPAHAVEYRRNAESVRGRLSALDAAYRSGLADCRLHEAVTSHAAFGYLAERYGFTQVPVAGVSPENEPSIVRLREITDLVRSKGIKVIFFETLVSPKLAETLAGETGATPAVFNPLEGLTEEEQAQGKDYFTVMRENLENLRRGLECA